jgi:hypothetical protein
MELEAREGSPARQQVERRRQLRYTVDEEASLLLVNHGSTVSGRILDLCLEGCRIRTGERFLAGILVRVEVIFKVLGVAFRILGVTQWTDQRYVTGIRFVDMTSHRQAALAELLGEIEARDAARGAKEVSADRPQAPTPSASAPVRPEAVPPGFLPPKPVASKTVPEPVPADGAQKKRPDSAGKTDSPVRTAETPAAKRALRAQFRHPVDTGATITLINLGSVVHGRILDLSLGGCCIGTDDRFPVGIFRRVETEFRLEGLPFRLGGVTQTMYDKWTVGIRFLDMSQRKREQLTQLIEEIEELQGREESAEAGDDPPWRAKAGERARTTGTPKLP